MILELTVQVPQPGKSNVRLTSQAPTQVELFVSASQVTCVPPPFRGKVPEVAVVVNGESVIPAPDVAEGL